MKETETNKLELAQAADIFKKHYAPYYDSLVEGLGDYLWDIIGNCPDNLREYGKLVKDYLSARLNEPRVGLDLGSLVTYTKNPKDEIRGNLKFTQELRDALLYWGDKQTNGEESRNKLLDAFYHHGVPLPQKLEITKETLLI